MKLVFLDSAPLSTVSDPKTTPVGVAMSNWITSMLTAGHRIYIPEVIDYELRREMIRAGKNTTVAELDKLKTLLYFLPINSDAMLLAADLWAQVRNSGLATGDPKKIDIDVILAAQALTEAKTLGMSSSDIVIATTNIGHLSRFATADLWSKITP
jgi:predicted nucleic acid-binding protein